MTEPTGPGRPRDPRTQRAILEAARRLLIRDGYDAVSIDAVAKEAGVSRPTVYRRWSSKAHLIFDATFEQPTGELLQSTGDFENDLLVFVQSALGFWAEPVVEAAALGILSDRRRDPQLHIRTQELLDQRAQAAFRDLVRGGIVQGAVRPDVDIDTLYQTLIGAAFYAVQVQQRTPSDLAENLCALIIHGSRAVPNREGQP